MVRAQVARIYRHVLIEKKSIWQSRTVGGVMVICVPSDCNSYYERIAVYPVRPK